MSFLDFLIKKKPVEKTKSKVLVTKEIQFEEMTMTVTARFRSGKTVTYELTGTVVLGVAYQTKDRFLYGSNYASDDRYANPEVKYASVGEDGVFKFTDASGVNHHIMAKELESLETFPIVKTGKLLTGLSREWVEESS